MGWELDETSGGAFARDHDLVLAVIEDGVTDGMVLRCDGYPPLEVVSTVLAHHPSGLAAMAAALRAAGWTVAEPGAREVWLIDDGAMVEADSGTGERYVRAEETSR